MKLQVTVVTVNDDVQYALQALVAALNQKETAELLEAFPDDEHFSMEAGNARIGLIKIVITKNPK
jgi:uncharacterized protein (DUF1684 family)